MADLTPEQQAALDAARSRVASSGLSPEQQAALAAARQRLQSTLPDVDLPAPTIENPVQSPLSGREMGVDGRPPLQRASEFVDGVTNGVIRGVTLGLVDDEARAGLAAAMGFDYGENLERERQLTADFRERNPIASMVSEVGGAMAIPAGPIGAAKGLGARMLAGSGVGALGGATFGFMEGEGGFESRAEDARNLGAVGGILGGLVPAAGAVGARVVSPLRGADPERLALASRLDDAGVRNITAGQRTGSERLLRAEDMLQPTTEQLEDFTAAAMRTAGSDAPRATTTALREAQEDIVQRMDDALSGVSVTPNASMAQAADDIAARYSELVPAGSLTPRIRGIAEEITEQATSPNPKPISLDLMRRWRTEIGTLRTSNDPATREAAQSLAALIDDATDTALRAAGREGDIAALGEARREYRNVIALQTASTRAGVNPRVGILSPEALRSITATTQGRRQVAQGLGTDLDELANAGAGILAPLPTVMAGGQRLLPQAANVSSAMAGAMPGLSSGNPLLAAAGAFAAPMAANAARNLGQRALRSRPVSGILANQLIPNGQALDSALNRGLLGGLSSQ